MDNSNDAKKSTDSSAANDRHPDQNKQSGKRFVYIIAPKWFRAAPYFMSAFLFLSGLFALFSPLPLLGLGVRFRKKKKFSAQGEDLVTGGVQSLEIDAAARGLLELDAERSVRSFSNFPVWPLLGAVLTNSILVYLLGGVGSLAVYFVLTVSLSLSLPVYMRVFSTPEKTALATLVTMIVGSFAVLLGYMAASGSLANLTSVDAQAPQQAGNFLTTIASGLYVELNQFLDQLIQSLTPEARKNWLGETEPELWREEFLKELPSALIIFAMVAIWSNLLIILRTSPQYYRDKFKLTHRFFQEWKAPQWLVWPTIVSGAFIVFQVDGVSVVALNLFKILMAIYAMQGLSILSFVFDVWKIKGIFRTLGFLFVVLLMMPLLLAIGFFDLWFDFRSKLRQS